jgi:hypothetical protein
VSLLLNFLKNKKTTNDRRVVLRQQRLKPITAKVAAPKHTFMGLCGRLVPLTPIALAGIVVFLSHHSNSLVFLGDQTPLRVIANDEFRPELLNLIKGVDLEKSFRDAVGKHQGALDPRLESKLITDRVTVFHKSQALFLKLDRPRVIAKVADSSKRLYSNGQCYLDGIALPEKSIVLRSDVGSSDQICDGASLKKRLAALKILSFLESHDLPVKDIRILRARGFEVGLLNNNTSLVLSASHLKQQLSRYNKVRKTRRLAGRVVELNLTNKIFISTKKSER